MEDFEIFRDKQFSSLLEDIYVSSARRSEMVDSLINDLREMVETPEDATMVIPMIVQYLDVGVKNDKHLIDLASIVEKYVKNIRSIRAEAGGSSLDDEDIRKLMEEEEAALREEIKALEPSKNDIEE